jgi:hypothetical protein
LNTTAASLPALKNGWTRDFLLKVDGWAKDADANTAFSENVLPLPFHAMSGYPYKEDRAFSARCRTLCARLPHAAGVAFDSAFGASD